MNPFGHLGDRGGAVLIHPTGRRPASDNFTEYYDARGFRVPRYLISGLGKLPYVPVPESAGVGSWYNPFSWGTGEQQGKLVRDYDYATRQVLHAQGFSDNERVLESIAATIMRQHEQNILRDNPPVTEGGRQAGSSEPVDILAETFRDVGRNIPDPIKNPLKWLPWVIGGVVALYAAPAIIKTVKAIKK